MNGGRTIATAQNAADSDDRDINQEMFAIACVAWIGEGLEITTNGTDIDDLGHEIHP